MRKLVLFITTVLLCAPAVAQKQYSLEECINIALQNNTKLKTSENEISSAKEQKKEAFANYIPQVSATAAGFVANKGLVQMNLSPLGIPQTMETAALHRRTNCDGQQTCQGGNRGQHAKA